MKRTSLRLEACGSDQMNLEDLEEKLESCGFLPYDKNTNKEWTYLEYRNSKNGVVKLWIDNKTGKINADLVFENNSIKELLALLKIFNKRCDL